MEIRRKRKPFVGAKTRRIEDLERIAKEIECGNERPPSGGLPGVAKCRKYWPKQVDTFLQDLRSWLTPTKMQEEIKDKVAQLHQEAAARSFLLEEAG